MLCGEPSEIDGLSLYPGEEDQTELIRGGPLARRTVVHSVYMTVRSKVKPSLGRLGTDHSYREMDGYVENVVAGWLAFGELEQRCSGILTGSLMERDSPIDFKLVALVTAVEQIAAGLGASRAMDVSAFELIRNRLVEQLPKCLHVDLDRLFSDRFRNINGKTLRASIDSLLDMQDSLSVEKVTFGNRDFAADVTKTRNAITHPRTGKDLERARDIRKMVLLVDSLECLLKHHLLLRAGMQESALGEHYQTNYRLREYFGLRIRQFRGEA